MAAGKEQPAAIAEEVLENTEKRVNACKQIIMGFLGGRFSHGNLAVEVKELERKSAKSARVIFV